MPLPAASGVKSACSALPARSRPPPAPAKCSSAIRRTGNKANRMKSRSPLRPRRATSRAPPRTGGNGDNNTSTKRSPARCQMP